MTFFLCVHKLKKRTDISMKNTNEITLLHQYTEKDYTSREAKFF